MKHYKFGYARVSTEQQNLARQLDMLTQYGVDYIFNEKMTGTKRDRPELNKLLDRMMEGDTVVIESLSRLGRSTKDLIELVELFRAIVADGQRSILFSTHITSDLEKCATHIAFIKDGEMQYTGSLDDFRDHYKDVGVTLEDIIVHVERRPLDEGAII